MLRDQPLLTILGRRGRGAVAEALLDGDVWTVRGLARAAGVAPATAARAVQEFESLGALEVIRPGRDAQIRLVPGSRIVDTLRHLRVPDMRGGAARAFAKAYGRPEGVRSLLRWQDLEDQAADPQCPTRIAVLCRDVDAALDAVGPALDGVREEGWPAPDVTVWSMDDLQGDDIVATAILQGLPL